MAFMVPLNSSLDDRALSHLLKAEELLRSIANSDPSALPSLRITQAQDAAEHAFRSILFAFGIRRVGTHNLDAIARRESNTLAPAWADLEPLLDGYHWLVDERNVMRYNHVDVPGHSDPPVTDAMIERATRTARRLLELARRVVRRDHAG